MDAECYPSIEPQAAVCLLQGAMGKAQVALPGGLLFTGPLDMLVKVWLAWASFLRVGAERPAGQAPQHSGTRQTGGWLSGLCTCAHRLPCLLWLCCPVA